MNIFFVVRGTWSGRILIIQNGEYKSVCLPSVRRIRFYEEAKASKYRSKQVRSSQRYKLILPTRHPTLPTFVCVNLIKMQNGFSTPTTPCHPWHQTNICLTKKDTKLIWEFSQPTSWVNNKNGLYICEKCIIRRDATRCLNFYVFGFNCLIPFAHFFNKIQIVRVL